MRWFRRSPTTTVVVNNYVGGPGEADEQLIAVITSLHERLNMLDLNALTQEVAETRGVANSAVTLIGTLRGEVASVSAQIADALAAESAAESEVADLRAALEAAQAQVDSLVTSLDEGQADLAAAIGDNSIDPSPQEPLDETPDEPVTPDTGEATQPVEEVPSADENPVDPPTNGNEGTSPDIEVDPGTADTAEGETPA